VGRPTYQLRSAGGECQSELAAGSACACKEMLNRVQHDPFAARLNSLLLLCCYRIRSSLAILSGIGGCVLKRLAIPPAENGFTMNM